MRTLRTHQGTYDKTVFGLRIRHCWLAVWTIEQWLDVYKPKRILELGTGDGGLSLYLAMWARLNRAYFATMDHQEPSWDVRQTLLRLDAECWIRNILSTETRDEIKEWIGGSRVCIYCDNGNKTRELAIYQSLLRKGDSIGCHDWGTEVEESEMQVMQKYGYEPVFEPYILSENDTLQMFWEKKA